MAKVASVRLQNFASWRRVMPLLLRASPRFVSGASMIYLSLSNFLYCHGAHFRSLLLFHARDQPVEPLVETCARGRGRHNDFDLRMNAARVFPCEFRLEGNVRQQ